VAKSKRNVFDDLADGIRQLFDDLDKALNPEKRKQRQRVPVPVPVRPNPPDSRDRQYPPYR
jgi:hypothetical protein